MRLTIRQLFFALLFISLFLMTLRPVTDPDFWWHLRTGQLIAETHVIPRTDPYSFTNNDQPWVTHEWLSELIIYSLYCLGSYSLLIIVFSLIITTAFFFAYLRCPSRSRPYIAGFVLLLGAVATAPTWGVRPQMISLLLTGLVLLLLTRYWQEDRIKYIIPLPLITLLWVNLHAGYLLGLVVIAIFITGGLIEIFIAEVFKKSDNSHSRIKSLLILCGIFGLSGLSTLANPNGVQILIYPFQTLTSNAMQQFIQEWLSPDFHQVMWQPLVLFILAFIGFGLIGKKSISPINIILTLVFGYAAFLSARHVPLFAIVAIPVLAEEIDAVVNLRFSIDSLNRPFSIAANLILLLLLFVTALRFTQVIEIQAKSESDTFPKAAVDWILENHPVGNMFNSYSWGGYLIWRLYPEYPVYIDGRADVYGDAFLNNYMSVYLAQPGWQQTLESYSVHFVLIEPGSNLANTLQQTSGWKIVFENKGCILFTNY